MSPLLSELRRRAEGSGPPRTERDGPGRTSVTRESARLPRFAMKSRSTTNSAATDFTSRAKARSAAEARRAAARARLDLAAGPLRKLQSQRRRVREMDGDVRADRALLQVSLVVSIVGMSLVVFLAYCFVFTGLQEARTQKQLLELYSPNVPSNTEKFFRNHLLTSAHLEEGQPAAVLTIPAIGLRQVVIEGSSATDLTKGPGLMPGTALPGTKGNAVIAGRRTTAGAPFGHILNLRVGDPITVATRLGEFRYRVTAVGTVSSGIDPIAPTLVSQLTLVTSNPPVLSIGRGYVKAKLISQAATAPVPTRPPSAAQRGLAGDSSAIPQTVLWGAIFVLSLFGVVTAYRRWKDKIWVVYLLSTPVVLAIALVWFENVYRLLPATL